jgi:hypothetical protein
MTKHESFYVINSAIQEGFGLTYRMGGALSDVKYAPKPLSRRAQAAKQSLIIPHNIDFDKTIDIAENYMKSRSRGFIK